MSKWRIGSIRSYVVQTLGVGSNYASRDPERWIVDKSQANPLSRHPERTTLRTGTASADAGSLVEIESQDDTIGIATGTGWLSSCSIIEDGISNLIVAANVRDIARLWGQMYCATLPHGRKRMALVAISVVDLALWDLLGQLRGEPVYRLAGGASRGGWREPSPHGRLRSHSPVSRLSNFATPARAATKSSPCLAICFMVSSWRSTAPSPSRTSRDGACGSIAMQLR